MHAPPMHTSPPRHGVGWNAKQVWSQTDSVFASTQLGSTSPGVHAQGWHAPIPFLHPCPEGHGISLKTPPPQTWCTPPTHCSVPSTQPPLLELLVVALPVPPLPLPPLPPLPPFPPLLLDSELDWVLGLHALART